MVKKADKEIIDIQLILSQTATKLYEIGDEMHNINSQNSKLIFPIQNQPIKGKKSRVSEQELRQCFIEVIRELGYIYSIETPTKYKYRFVDNTNENVRSASLDLCIHSYEANSYNRKVCIEFKAHNMSKSIYKDLYKLTKEDGNNLYFHLLESANSGTLTSDEKRKGLIVKLQRDLVEVCENKEINADSLTIAIVCLSPQLLIYITIEKESLKKKKMNLLDENKWISLFNSIPNIWS